MKRYIYIFVTLALGLAAAGVLAQLGGGGFRGPGAVIKGPTSSTDNAIVRFDGTSGKRVQNSGITIDDSDRLTNSSQPCFLAFNSANDLDVTGAGAIPQIDFDTEVFDQGADFAADTFTAPITGRYLFAATVRFTGITAAADSVFLILTTSNRTYEVSWSDTDNIPLGMNFIITAITDMDFNDTATVSVQVNGEVSNVVDITGSSVLVTYFSGCLIS